MRPVPEVTPPPLHRAASAWAVSVLLGALVAATVCCVGGVVVGLPRSLGIAGNVLVGALALGAALEGLAAVVRRRGPRTAWLLLLAPPVGLLLILAGVAWVQAWVPGSPQATLEQFGARLGRGLSFLTLGPLGAVALLLGPLGWARVVRPRLRTACAVAAAGPAALCVVLGVLEGFSGGCVRYVDLTTSTLLVACVLGETLGLALGDRLEPRLAAWLRLRLHGPDASGASG